VLLCPNPARDLRYGQLDLTLAIEAAEDQATTLIAFVNDSGHLIDDAFRSLHPVGDGRARVLSVDVPPAAERFAAVLIVPLATTGRFDLQEVTVHPRRYRTRGPADEADRSLVYIHIPKAGGNTVNEFLCAHLPREAVLECRRPGDNLVDQAPLDRFAVVTGHFGHKALELFETSAPRVMTVLRHPVDQVASFYYYLRAQPWPQEGYPGFRQQHGYPGYRRVMDLVHGESLLAFVQSELPNARMLSDNHQTWKIGHGAVRWGGIRFVPRDRSMLEQAKANLDRYDVVGLQEDLLSTILLMCYRFDLPIRDVRLPRINVNRERRRLEELPPEALESIRRRNAMDLELYEHATGLFAAQLREMIEDVGQEQYDAWLEQLRPSTSQEVHGPMSTKLAKPPRPPERAGDRFLQSALKCAACGAPKLARADDSTLRCPECGHEYAVSDGLPCVNPEGRFTKLTKDDYNRTHHIDAHRREAVFGIWRELLSLIDAPRGRTLELGCGTGLLSYGLAKYGGFSELHVSDISPEFVRETLAQVEAFETPTYAYVCDANNLPFASESFDLVVGNSILHHLLQYAETIQQTHDVLTAEGAAVFAEPLLDSKALTALFARLMVRLDDEFGLGVLDERDRQGLTRAIHHWTVVPTLKDRPERLQQMEDKYIFSRAEMESLAHQCGFRSFGVHNFEKPITVPIAPDYLKYTSAELTQHGLAPEKVRRFAYLFECFGETYGSMLSGQIHTPMVFFVFRK
jgi:ubiquinone/menaquinone biosynthesis C-methylase UbiE